MTPSATGTDTARTAHGAAARVAKEVAELLWLSDEEEELRRVRVDGDKVSIHRRRSEHLSPLASISVCADDDIMSTSYALARAAYESARALALREAQQVMGLLSSSTMPEMYARTLQIVSSNPEADRTEQIAAAIEHFEEKIRDYSPASTYATFHWAFEMLGADLPALNMQVAFDVRFGLYSANTDRSIDGGKMSFTFTLPGAELGARPETDIPGLGL